MAAQETFTLDSLALNDGTTFGVLNVSWPPPRERQEWIGAADSEAQLLFRKPLHENRTVTLRVAVMPQASMDLALGKIAQVVDKLAKASQYTDGIGLTWTPATATLSCTFDVLAGEVTDLPIDWENGWLSQAPEFTIELTCKPYWRGTETLTSTTSSSTPFVTLEVANVTGDIPALGRLIVTDLATQSRRHVEWGLEGPLTYNNATSLLVDSDNMVTSGFAGSQSTLSGAYDPNATGNSVISATLYSTSQPTAVCGTGNLSHVGTFRVKARVHGGNPGDLVRLSWKALDGPLSSNDWAELQQNGLWEELDLGTITIPTATSGTQRWTGQIEAMGLTSGTSITVDYLILVPAINGYGKARASYAYASGALVGFDAFVGTTAGSNLATRSAPLGGSWATSGDTTDFQFADNFVISPNDGVESITRNASAVETSGRFAILGTSVYTDMQVDVRFRYGGGLFSGTDLGLIARWVDSSNYLRLIAPSQNGSGRIETVIAGSVTVIATSTWFYTGSTSSLPYRLRLIAFASGRVIGLIMSDDGSVLASMQATSSALATGGALDDGKPGLRDRSNGDTATRRYTEFSVSVPQSEPIAIYSGKTMQIRYDDTFRDDSTGTYTGRPQSYRGSRFLVPVGTSRVLVKARRNDIETTQDDQVTDSTQIQVGWTPRGLVVPR